MTSALLQTLLKSLALLAGLLLVGMFLRAKVRLFQKLLLPASVIGGFVGLLLGPQLWGEHAILSFHPDAIAVWSLLPGILIVPIFASVPLGMFMHEKKHAGPKSKDMISRILMYCGLFGSAGGLQMALGFGFTLVAMKLAPSLTLYRTFGFELSQGFSGGHGTAGAVGNILEGYGMPYWETAQGVATTFATIGLVGGMLLGIFFINRASAKGETKVISKPGQLPEVTRRGINKNMNAQDALGRETTNSSSIETITVHLGLILLGCGLGYFLLGKVKEYQIPGLSSIPVWFYALLIMYVINGVLIKAKLDWLIDKKVKNKITGTMSDFAITGAIASIPVKTVSSYLLPIVILSILGFACTCLLCFPMFKFCYGKEDYPTERAIMSWGVNTGVMINGMMLLKICDPDYETPVLNEFSMGFALMSVISMITSPITYGLLGSGTTMQNFLFSAFLFLLYFIMAMVGKAMRRNIKG